MTLKSLLEKQREELDMKLWEDGWLDNVRDKRVKELKNTQSKILGFIREWAEKEKDALILMWGSFDYKDGCKDILSDLINLIDEALKTK